MSTITTNTKPMSSAYNKVEAWAKRNNQEVEELDKVGVYMNASKLCKHRALNTYNGSGFMDAVLDNDLHKAVVLADSTNIKYIAFYVYALCNVVITGDDL